MAPPGNMGSGNNTSLLSRIFDQPRKNYNPAGRNCESNPVTLSKCTRVDPDDWQIVLGLVPSPGKNFDPPPSPRARTITGPAETSTRLVIIATCMARSPTFLTKTSTLRPCPAQELPPASKKLRPTYPRIWAVVPISTKIIFIFHGAARRNGISCI